MTTAKPKTFLQKIAAASAEMDNPKKRATNPHFKSKFASLADTMDVIEPILEKHGLSHQAYFTGTQLVYSVYDAETGDRHNSSIDLRDVLQGLEGNVWQQIGQAFTYLRRYLAQAYWGLVPDDDDAQSAPSRPAAQRKPSLKDNQAKAEIAAGPNADEHYNGGGAL